MPRSRTYRRSGVIVPHLLDEYSWKSRGVVDANVLTTDESLEVTKYAARDAIADGRFRNKPLLWEHTDVDGFQCGRMIDAYIDIQASQLKADFEFDLPEHGNETGDVSDIVSLFVKSNDIKGLSLSHRMLIPEGAIYPTELTVCQKGLRGPLATIQIQASLKQKIKNEKYTESARYVLFVQASASELSSPSSSATMSGVDPQYAQFLAWKASTSGTPATGPSPAAAIAAPLPPAVVAAATAAPVIPPAGKKKRAPAVAAAKTVTPPTPPPPPAAAAEEDDDEDEDEEEEKEETPMEEVEDEDENEDEPAAAAPAAVDEDDTLFETFSDPKNKALRILGKTKALSVLKSLDEKKRMKEEIAHLKAEVEKEKKNKKEVYSIVKQNLKELHPNMNDEELDHIATAEDPGSKYLRQMATVSASARPVPKRQKIDREIDRIKQSYHAKGSTAAARLSSVIDMRNQPSSSSSSSSSRSKEVKASAKPLTIEQRLALAPEVKASVRTTKNDQDEVFHQYSDMIRRHPAFLAFETMKKAKLQFPQNTYMKNQVQITKDCPQGSFYT